MKLYVLFIFFIFISTTLESPVKNFSSVHLQDFQGAPGFDFLLAYFFSQKRLKKMMQWFYEKA